MSHSDGAVPEVRPGAEPFFAEGSADAQGRRVGVLLSHGFTGSPASVAGWGRHLASLGYAVSVPRLPGHGTTVEDMLPTRYSDWSGAVEAAYQDLAARCDSVVVGGLSMGGSLALWLGQRHPEIAGLMLVNPAVASTNRQLLLLPLAQHLVRTFPGIGNDIKKPGVDGIEYSRTPLKPLVSFRRAWKGLREDLPKITCPVLLFRSAEDHVVDPSSARIILAGISSRDVTERVLTDSYHVATLDHDAPRILAESADFVARVAGGGATPAEGTDVARTAP